MKASIRFPAVCLGWTLMFAAGCDSESDDPGTSTKPDVVYSGTYGHVPERVAVDLPSLDGVASSALRTTATVDSTCTLTNIMHDHVKPTIAEVRGFQRHVFLALPILDVYVEAAQRLAPDFSGRIFLPAGLFAVELSQELVDAIQSRFDVPVEPFLPPLGSWFASPGLCLVRDPADELQTSVYVDRAGAAGVDSCDDLRAFPESFRWSDDLTRFEARALVPWWESWRPSLAALFSRPLGVPVSYAYDTASDTQRLVVAPRRHWGHVSQIRGCGADRCVELTMGTRELSAPGVIDDPFLGGMVPLELNRYTYLAGKADDRASAFRARYHSIEDYYWEAPGGEPTALHERDRVLERHSALFDGEGCLVAYCAPVPADVASCFWQLDEANAGLSVPSLPFYDDAIASEVSVGAIQLGFDVSAFPAAPEDPWAAFVVVRAGGDPSRGEDLLADGSAVFDGAPFLDANAWGDAEDYAGAEVWRVVPAAVDGGPAVTHERLAGTVSVIGP